MPLRATDPHYWGPIPEVVQWLTDRLEPKARVLEIGPGHAPFFRANEFVDFDPRPIPGRLALPTKCDIATEPLPFEDKSFDFVYARHVLEDMWNPFHLIGEMERVAKSGYIETPSPIAELCRGVDGGAPPYRGYHHHRWVVWDQEGELRFVTKYPVIEYLDIDEARLETLLRHPRCWNTYLCWDGHIKFKHIQSPLDYDIPNDYRRLLHESVESSVVQTGAFLAFRKAA